MKEILKLILAKWIFKKPKKKFFLIYDRHGLHFLTFLVKKKTFEILDVRYESVNFYVLLFTIFNNGFLNLRLNYKINYIKVVSPRFVITSIDNNLSFYNLKNNYNKTKYIAVQEGRRDNIFFEQCKNYYKKENIRLSVDFFFVMGKNEIKRYSKYIDSKFYILGLIKNNYFYLRASTKCKKQILFISRKSNFLNNKDHEVNVFNSLYKYSVINKYKLILSTRSSPIEEEYYRNILIKGNWHYHPHDYYDAKSTYQLMNRSEIIAYTYSTLGLEALIKFKKVAIFLINPKYFPILNYPIKSPKKSPFWTTNINDINVTRLIDKIKSYPNSKWQSFVKKYISNIIHYNPKNKIFFKAISNIK